MIKEGSKAPAFKLDSDSDSGEKVSLKDCVGNKVVLYFYPKDMTTGCTQQACDFRDQFTHLRKLKVLVFGVSPDSVASHQKFKIKYKLPFPLLADEDHAVAEKYGVWKEKSMYGRKYMGIERTTFLIDEDGKISKIFPKVKVAGHVELVKEILSA